MSTDTNTPIDAVQVESARERYASALQRYVLRQIPDKQGLAGEIIAAVWKSFQEQPAGEIGEQAGEWLFLNARRRLQSYLQGTAKKMEGDEDTAPAVEGDETEEPHVTMQRLIDRLTPKQQEAVRLRFQNDFSVAEIARITELTPYNVGGLVHNAVAKLARGFRAQHPAESGKESKGVGEDARLTLYALGEMEDADRRSFEDSLIDKKTAATRTDEIKAVAAVIGQTLAIEAGAPAPRTVRKRKRSGLAVWLAFPRVLAPIAAVVVVGGGLVFWLSQADETPRSGPREKVDFKLKPADWKEPGAATEEGPGKVSGGAGGEGSGSVNTPGRSAAAPRLAGTRVATGKPAMAAGRNAEVNRDHPTDRTDRSDPSDAADAAGEPTAAPQGGMLTGPVQGGVAAVNRGKTGERQNTVPAAATGKTDESTQTGGNPPAKNEGESGAVDQAKPDLAKAAAAGEKSSPKAKPAPKDPKNKAGRTEKPFVSPREAAVSRLGPDVPVASVGRLKNALRQGRRPAPGSVKVEELLNYFPTQGAAPAGADLFAATLESAEAPWDAQKRLVRVSLKGREVPVPPRGPANLVLLVDISGSMEAPNRLPLVKEAVRLLLGRLRPDDRVGLVTYAAEPKLALMPTPVAELQEILRVFDRLEAKGPTNGGAGMELAYDLAKAHGGPDGRNCVIMCTDGDFNSGPTREEELAKIIDRQADSGVRLSIYGFGRGKQIDARLEKLALRGGGASGYVNTRREAEQVLTGEINGIFSPLAKELEVKVVFNPEQVDGYRLLGYDEPVNLATGKVGETPDNRVVLPGHTLTALYEVVPKTGASAGELLAVQLNYLTPQDGEPHRQDFSLRDRGTPFAQAGLDFKFAAAVGAFGLVLNQQAPAGMTLETVEAWARETLGEDEGGYRSDFLSLVEQARALKE